MEDRILMLDGSNYLEWEKIMSAYLRSKGLWQITSGGDVRPTPLDPTADPKPSAANIAECNKEIADWDKENDKALGLIQMKCTINLSTYDESTSCSTWNGLKKAFATPTATAVFNDFQKLLAIKVSGNKHPGPEMDEMWTLMERLKANQVDLPKFLRAFLLFHALPSSLGAVVTVQLQTVAATDLDFQSIRSVVQLESERKTPSLAHRLSAVKHKGPADPSFQQQKKHNRSSAPAPEAPSGSSDYKGKGKGKTRRAFRGGKKNKQQHFHSHIADAVLIDIPPTIVSQPSHAGPMTTTIASFGKGSISY